MICNASSKIKNQLNVLAQKRTKKRLSTRGKSHPLYREKRLSAKKYNITDYQKVPAPIA